MIEPLAVSYVLPLRWTSEQHLDLSGYLHRLATNVEEVIVVDGSPEDSFERHRNTWKRYATHVPPDPALRFRNGKVSGVLTGVALARHERIVIADDDVRYDRDGLRRIADLLDDADLVRPQNYFRPVPWHAAWDTARSLINRAFGRDFPGTFGVRRSVLLATGGYDGDVLFENLELIRTVEAAGGRVASPLDLYVERRPPEPRRFWSQRVRQAYDDFAIPSRMGLWLVLAPAAAAGARISPALPAAAAGASILVAEAGRRRAGGAAVFPFRASLAAPLWLAERSVTSWMALGSRLLFGGVTYGGTRFNRAASSRARLIRGHRRHQTLETSEEELMARDEGVKPKELEDQELRKELRSIYRTREDTFLNGTEKALEEHTKRMFELEREFLKRFPREAKPAARRTRAGARRGRRVRGTKAKPQPSTTRTG